MNNISIEEIREALTEAKDECSEVQSKCSDLTYAVDDVVSNKDEVETASYEAEEKVKRALDLLDGWVEDKEQGIDPEVVEQFLKNNVQIIDRLSEFLVSLRGNIFQFARDLDIELSGE